MDFHATLSCMELHASTPEDAAIVRRFADEVRAELARKRLTAADLAAALGVSQHTIGSRLNGKRPFNAFEMILVSRFLGIAVSELWMRATGARALAVAS